MTGILDVIRKLIGAGDSESPFDVDILMYINATMSTLTQLGVGPTVGFIATNTSLWTDFIGDSIKLEMVKTYVYLKVKLIFDPPLSSAAVEAMNKTASEQEWRILLEVDQPFVIPEVVDEDSDIFADTLVVDGGDPIV